MKYSLALVLVFSLAVQHDATAQNNSGKYVNFSVPGATTTPAPGFYQLPGTFVKDLNDSGQIIGYYTSESSVPIRGFERSPSGKFTLLDDPGAGTPVSGGALTYAGTTPYAINSNGVIVGSFATTVPVTEAFVLNPKGSFSNFFTPAGSYYSQALAINSSGVITGRTGIYNPTLYIGLTYGFVLTPDGKTVTFQSPSATQTGWLNGTTSVAINSAGATTGYYYDANSVAHTYIRAADGGFTEFEVPGAGTTSYTGAWPIEINNAGDVIGFYYDGSFRSYPYFRLADGTLINIASPAGIGAEIYPDWMNQKGDIAGTYQDANGAAHAIVRLKNGHFAFFTDPDAGMGAGQGTFSIRINNAGQVAGYYVDANNVYHGFMWTLAD
jgi:uncharacterized membrane protein